MEKVIVFGGNGFLGQYVVQELLARGFEVVVYDLSPPERDSGAFWIQGDIADLGKVTAAAQGAAYAYNFCSIADIGECTRQPIKAASVNIMGHLNILQACVGNHVKRIFFASSVYVYGNKGSFYRITKQSCEQFTQEYFNKFNLPYTILRYGTLFGIGAQKWNSVYRYVSEAIKTGSIGFDGTGEEKRRFIYIGDASRLSVDCMAEKYINQCVALTSSDATSITDLFKIIGEMLGREITINYSKGSSDHYNMVPHSFTSNVAGTLVPNPYIDLPEGLLKIIEAIFRDSAKEEKNG